MDCIPHLYSSLSTLATRSSRLLTALEDVCSPTNSPMAAFTIISSVSININIIIISFLHFFWQDVGAMRCHLPLLDDKGDYKTGVMMAV